MRPCRILVVDDEENVRDVTRLLLEMSGHTVVCVEDGHGALREISAHPYDIVITDMLMPEMDGVELVNELKRRHSPLRIIAMSGGGHVPKESYLQIAHLSGAHAVLPKPFNRDQLEQVLRTAMGEPA